MHGAWFFFGVVALFKQCPVLLTILEYIKGGQSIRAVPVDGESANSEQAVQHPHNLY